MHWKVQTFVTLPWTLYGLFVWTFTPYQQWFTRHQQLSENQERSPRKSIAVARNQFDPSMYSKPFLCFFHRRSLFHWSTSQDSPSVSKRICHLFMQAQAPCAMRAENTLIVHFCRIADGIPGQGVSTCSSKLSTIFHQYWLVKQRCTSSTNYALR